MRSQHICQTSEMCAGMSAKDVRGGHPTGVPEQSKERPRGASSLAARCPASISCSPQPHRVCEVTAESTAATSAVAELLLFLANCTSCLSSY